MIHLDTHVVVWIAAGLIEKVPTIVLAQLEAHQVAISPMVRLELTHLHEVGRLRHPADRVLVQLRQEIGLVEDATTLTEVVNEAEAMTWTRDPFDLIIAAQAVAARCLLATADRRMRDAIPSHTAWA